MVEWEYKNRPDAFCNVRWTMWRPGSAA